MSYVRVESKDYESQLMQSTRRMARWYIAALFAAAACTPLRAALAPQEIDKTIMLQGDAAVGLAKLFGLDTTAPSSVPLPLWKYEVWSSLNSDDDRWSVPPTRYNVIEFRRYSRLAIFSRWLDLGTRLPQPKRGFFSFRSAFLLPELEEPCNPWARLVRELKADPNWIAAQKTHIRRCFASDHAEVCIEVEDADDYAQKNKRSGFNVVVLAHVLKED